MHSFTFDGLNSRTYCKMFVSGGGTHNAPERDIESVSVPGRNGELTIDHGRFKNIKVSYSAWIIEDVDENIVKARNWLCSKVGYKRLYDDYHPDEFRMARMVGGIDFNVSTTTPVAAIATIQFDCMPQRWLNSGLDEISIRVSSGQIITNPTFFPAKPLITIEGSGPATVTVSGKTISISDIGGTMFIDCDIERAYSYTAAKDDKITISNGYPTIPHGDSMVSYTAGNGGSVTSLKLMPRWWRV